MEKYTYRMIEHPISMNMTQVQRLFQNYRSAFIQLAVTYYIDYTNQLKRDISEDELDDLKERIILVLNKMEQKIPTNTIPIQSEDLHYQVARIYGDLGEKVVLVPLVNAQVPQKVLPFLGKVIPWRKHTVKWLVKNS